MIINNDQWTGNSNVSNLFCCFTSGFIVYVLLVITFILTYLHVSFYLMSLLVPFSRSQSVHCTVWQLTECDDTRYSRHTIFFPPEDEHIDA